jgi:hypothetical protein
MRFQKNTQKQIEIQCQETKLIYHDESISQAVLSWKKKLNQFLF